MALTTTEVDGKTYVQVADLQALLASARSDIALAALGGLLPVSKALNVCDSYQAVEKMLDRYSKK